MRDLALVLAALADPTRLQMLALLLRADELCVCDFVGVLDISQSKASRHLRYLWNAKLLDDRRAGLWVYYRIAEELDTERATLVKAVSQVMAGRDLSELDGKLQAWMAQKAKTNSCASGTDKPTPARRKSGAGAHKHQTGG